MTTYLLDFTATPLQPAAGGQLHKVIVTQRPQGLDNEHDSLNEAIVHLVKSFGMVGETDTFVPLASPSVMCISGQGSYVQEVQVEPANSVANLRPTVAEVLAAFPHAIDLDVTAGYARSFRLHQTRFVVGRTVGGEQYVQAWEGDEDAMAGQRYGEDWAQELRGLALRLLAERQEEIARRTAEAAALAAALGDAQ